MKVRLILMMILLSTVALATQPPKESPHGDAAIPKIQLTSQWKTKGHPYFVSWSNDASRIVSVSGYGKWLTVQDDKGHIDTESNIPIPYTYHLVVNSHEILMVGNTESNIAFYVTDLSTGNIIFQEPLPSKSERGSAQQSVHFALSQDGALLAVAYSAFSPGQPISFFDTKDWRKLSTVEVPVAGKGGVGTLAFSRDGTMLGFAINGGLVVMEVKSGETIKKIMVQPSDFAFSPDGTMLAIQLQASSEINPGVYTSLGTQIFRLSDGVRIASHARPAVGPNCKDTGEDCGWSSHVLWDVKSRFVAFVEGNDTLRFWNPFDNSANDTKIEVPNFSDMALSFDGTRLAVANGDNISVFKIGN
jgi:hypothetical protein